MSPFQLGAHRAPNASVLGKLRFRARETRDVSVLAIGALLVSACSSEIDPPGGVWEEGSTTSGSSSESPPNATSSPEVTGTNTGTVSSTPTLDSSGGTQGPSTTGTQATSTSTAVSPTSTTPEPTCTAPQPGRSPLRRLTRFEYSNSVEALLEDTSNAGQDLPAELLGSGFGNDADAQPSSAFLIEQYAKVAETIVANTPVSVLSKYDACIAEAAPDETACATSFLRNFAESAYRRPLTDSELQELVSLQQTLRELGDFNSSITGTMEVILQTPDFLYRLEFGETTPDGLKRPTGSEMASRLSYFLWGAPPDDSLKEAASNGELSTPAGVLANAQRLLEDPRSKRVVEYFFNNMLPINALTDQSRDPETFPSFSAQIGALMQEETTRFLEHAVFEGEGTWDAILTAPYTFLNEELAGFYGIEGVTGDEFRRVDVDTTKRLGLLTHASILTGTTVTNYTNPVRRGGFLMSHILCVDIPLPPDELLAKVKPPEPYSGKTGRERYTIHSTAEECRSCHGFLDPPGFALENYDAVGLWRDTENDVTIDASGTLANVGTFTGPTELVRLISESELAYECFAKHWQTFAYGRKLKEQSDDKCSNESLNVAFNDSGHDIKQLLLDITQTDGFLYLGEQL